jgi:ribonuclease HII
MKRQAAVSPTFEREMALWQAGYLHIAGIDEAGRGALAGPVVAAAVIAPPGSVQTGVWAKVRDSKAVSPQQRITLAAELQQAALAWATGCVEARRIDEIGIAAATRQAMLAAIASLAIQPDYLLIDWVRLPQINLPQQSPAKADAHIASVAAASILAKVQRDRLMESYAASCPCYDFARNKGYGAPAHLRAIAQHGPCPIHRLSFAPFALQGRLLP